MFIKSLFSLQHIGGFSSCNTASFGKPFLGDLNMAFFSIGIVKSLAGSFHEIIYQLLAFRIAFA